MTDDVHKLLRMVCKSFYSIECCVVLNALLRHNRQLSDEETANLLTLQHRVVRQAFASLKQGGIVNSIQKQDVNDRAPHMIWFVDYKRAVDAIRYRMHVVLHGAAPKKEEVSFFCPSNSCHNFQNKITPEEATCVIKNGQFVCCECYSPLQEQTNSEELKAFRETKAQLGKKFKPISDLLKVLQEQSLPEFGHTTDGVTNGINWTRGSSNSGYSGTGGSSGSGRSGPTALFDASQSNLGVVVDIVENTPLAQKAAEAMLRAGGVAAPVGNNANPSTTRKALPWEGIVGKSKIRPVITTASGGWTTISAPAEEKTIPSVLPPTPPQTRTQDRTAPAIFFSEKSSAYQTEFRRQLGVVELEHEEKQENITNFKKVDSTALETQYQEEAEQETETTEEPRVSVAGRMIPLSRVTEEDQEAMTKEEYETYGKLCSNDDEFTEFW